MTRADGDLDLEGSVREIQRVHPRYESGQANEAAIIEAIAEIARSDRMTERAAAEYLLTRTKLYADCTSTWADKSKITASTRWFSAGHFRQDESVWKQANVGERISKPAPVDYRDSVLEKKLARAAQPQGDGVRNEFTVGKA